VPYDAAMTLVMGIVAVLALLILTVVKFTDLVLLFKTIRRNRAHVVSPQPARPVDPQTRARLIELVAQGNKMQAIKDLRVATGLGIKEAKEAVDVIAAGYDISGVHRPRPDVPAATEERAWKLIAQGHTIQAVKLIREDTGLGFKEAKDVADGLNEIQV
jgi:ribosomal protein L7/L12